MLKTKRYPFTDRENLIIVQLVNFYGEDWDTISKQLPGRTAKQIHDRYHNYLRQGLRNSPWTDREDEILIRMYNAIGPKWSKMMNNLPGRSGNDIKNRWHKHLFKKFKNINDQNLKLNPKNNLTIQSNCQILPKNEESNMAKQGLSELQSFNFKNNFFNENAIFTNDYHKNANSQNYNSLQKNQSNVKLTNEIGNNGNTMKLSDDIFKPNPNSLFNTDFEIQEILEEVNYQNIDFLWI